jgi:spoIIIJ-associated protein
MDDTNIIKIAKETTDEFLAQFGLDAEISVDFIESDDSDKRYLQIDLQGENLSELVGYHGKNLEATKTILGLMIAKRVGDDNRVNIIVDINNYKERRKEYLRSYALRAAQQVRISGQDFELPPMKPYERRIIHMILKEEDGINTVSQGEGRDRKVIISRI